MVARQAGQGRQRIGQSGAGAIALHSPTAWTRRSIKSSGCVAEGPDLERRLIKRRRASVLESVVWKAQRAAVQAHKPVALELVPHHSHRLWVPPWGGGSGVGLFLVVVVVGKWGGQAGANWAGAQRLAGRRGGEVAGQVSKCSRQAGRQAGAAGR